MIGAAVQRGGRAAPSPAGDAADALYRAARSDRWVALAVGTVVLAVPFAAYTSFVLYQFYTKGSFLLDSGWFAFVMSAHDLRLANPLALGGGSFFATHIAPIFLATALLRRGLPVSDPQFFAFFMGLCQALPGLGVFWILRVGFGMRSPLATMLAGAIAIAFAFNGLALAIARYPHFEILVAASIILFAVALVRRQLIVATICFVVALATREDAGFHLFGILLVLIAVNRRRGLAWREQRAELTFAVSAAAYSAAALALLLAIATGPSALARIYIGEVPFASLTVGTVITRLVGWVVYRGYVILPAAIAALWAARARNPYILVGYAAFVPWGLLQLIAASDIAGTLSGYYAYPYLIASFWPLVGVLLNRRRGASGPAAAPLLAFSAMIAASFVGISHQYNPGGFALVGGFLDLPSPSRQAATERAAAQLAASLPALGTVVVDGSVAALVPNDVTWSETLAGRRSARPDTIVYFTAGYEAATARRLAATVGLHRYYRVCGTAIRLVTDRPPAPSMPLAGVLVPLGPAD